jgi:predicted RNase H-like HicB family nuclease
VIHQSWQKGRRRSSTDSEYKGYVADVLGLPGCMSEGKTLDEAIENIKDAIKGYLYVQEKHGRILEPKEEPRILNLEP